MRRIVAFPLILAITAVACTRAGSPETSASSVPTSAPGVSRSPAPASDIRFVLHRSYPVGDHIVVRIENVGNITYTYEFAYEACFLSYFDAQGRTFIIPPGTHCDIRAKANIRPGETKNLFEWDLDECLRDEWGCVKARPLDPGVYMIRGVFRALGDGPPAHAEATFEIQP